MAVYVHVSCLIERLIRNEPIENYNGAEQLKQCQRTVLQELKEAFSVIEKVYSVNIPESELFMSMMCCLEKRSLTTQKAIFKIKRRECHFLALFLLYKEVSEVKKMERKIILATHGNFAAGIQTSLALICGETKNVECLCAYMEQPYDLAKTVKDILKNNQQNELIVITDLFGGSVNNEFFNYVGNKQCI